ncbi:MAG: anaerobic selenocysteine-containing dehydrogenase/Fe-S-cluster-containing dehydrogenase component [Planctomycetota bacterium]|jgi:anaerobic selenocysteine-containing dehydrogenase/Fe-S-cluster-containing dehydrogenase component
MTTTQLALMIDLERCTGCKSCEAACKQTNALGPHSYRNRVIWFDDQQIPDINESPSTPRLDFLTVTCQQCERPACLRACPVNPKAISKDPLTGVVSIDESRCTGCGECALSCPYGAIGYNAEKHHAVKCDLCAERRENNLGPACAAVCPTRAISFNTREALLEQVDASQREMLDTDHFLQKPATIYLKRLVDQGVDRGDTTLVHTPQLMLDNKVRMKLTPAKASGSYRRADKTALATLPERIVPGGCNICFNGCPVKYHLRGDKLVNVYGNDEDPQFQGRICPKSQMTLQLYDNPHRLLHPLKRVGARGDNKFKPISWDQALSEIAQKLSAVRDQFGSEALAIQSGSRTGVLNVIGAIPMFAGLWGTPNVATTEPYCDLGKSVALDSTQGSGMLANVYTEEDIGSAEAYVYIGDNQAETRPVNFGMLNDWRINNRAKMIVVDPRLTATASKADEWLAIRSGTDMALGLGIIHFLFAQDLHDEAFCQRWVIGWQEWREFVIKQGYDLDWAASVTDLSIEQIASLATTIGEADGCMIFLSRGINQHTNSAQTNRVFMFIAAITGNWGRRGGGYFNVSSEINWQPPIIPDERKAQTRPALGKNPSSWMEAMAEGDPYPIKALITGNNPLGQWPDQARLREAIQSLDLIVHLELFKNATSSFADYVLPMASGIEKGGTTRFAEDRRIVWNDRLIDPPGEAKSDHWFWIELGKKFGFDDVLKEDYKDPRKLWDEVLVAATPDLQDASIEHLISQPNRTVRLPFFDPKKGGLDPVYVTEIHRQNPESKLKYPTDSGQLEFYTDKLEAKFNTVGLSALPEFYSEAEQLIALPKISYDDKQVASPFFDKETLIYGGRITAPQAADHSYFDTELVTGRPPAPHFHSWTHYFWQAQEMWPEMYCQIHPQKAQGLGIADGDTVSIETSNGKISARAWIHRGIRPSSVFIPIGWDEQQPYHPATGVNHLTGIKLDPVSQQANLKTHLCRVEKA